MSNWISIVVLLAIVIAVGLFRERWRVSRIEALARTRGLSRVFPLPDGGPQPATSLVSRLTVHGARLWGLVLTGTVDGEPVTIGEHESAEPGRKAGVWFTVATWPIAGAAGQIVMHKGIGPRALADAANAITDPIRSAVSEAVGLPVWDDQMRVDTPGGWTVIGEPIDRDRWLTPDKIRELDAWPHGGSFVRQDGFGAWRFRDPITADSLAQRLDQVPMARRLLL